MDFGAVTLSILVALIAVITAAYPMFKEVYYGSEAKLNFWVLGNSEHHIDAAFSNTGTKDFLINEVLLIYSLDGVENIIQLSTVDTNVVASPGKIYRWDLLPGHPLPTAIPEGFYDSVEEAYDAGESVCEIRVSVVNHENDEYTHAHKYLCNLDLLRP